nr:hypothetical protein [Tanacetum cinerariifolium]
MQYPRFIKLILADLIKKFLYIHQRIKEDYHSIKYDIPLVSVYTTGDVYVRGILIPDAFINEEIRTTNDFKEYEMVFMTVDVPMNQPQAIVSTQGMHRSTPRAYMKPTLTASPQGKKRKRSAGESNSPRQSHKNNHQKEETKYNSNSTSHRIEKMVEGEKDEESYASEFADSVLNDDVDDSGTRIEPGSHKDKPEYVDDDDDDDKGAKKVDEEEGGEMEDDAPPKGEKRVKRHNESKSLKSARGFTSKNSAKDSTTYVSKQQQQQECDAWVEETIIDEDEVIPKDETHELITELQDVDKRVPIFFDYERMKATLNDALSNKFKNAEEYAYHLEQTTNSMENQIVWESRQEDIRRTLPKPLVFFGPQ